MSRYETLNVSLQTDDFNNRNSARYSQTVDYAQQNNQIDNTKDAEDKVRKFRELYYKNEKLRRELKLLNARLNEKLAKVKFPAVKQRAASVDLNREPPSKALQRELENAFKQVKMYKNQIEVLKIKEQSTQNYAKVRDMQNKILYRDKEILDVQEQLKSIKNIKQLQDRKIVADLQNQDVKVRIEAYQKEHRELREKLKDIARKSRKREEEYKKQQAYLVSLSQKYRIAHDDTKNQEEEIPVDRVERSNNSQLRDNTEFQFIELKQRIANQKRINDEINKRFELVKKQVKSVKDETKRKNDQYKEKEALAKTLQTKIIALNRLIREQERKPKEKEKSSIENTEIKTYHINEESEVEVESEVPQEQNLSKVSKVSQEDASLKKILKDIENEAKAKENEEREWKGRLRKVEHGYAAPTDHKFQFMGKLSGFHVSLDENQAICGISFLFQDDDGLRQEPLQGRRSNIELIWELKSADKIMKLSGSFTEQSYLNQLIVISKNGNSGIFGAASTDAFTFKIGENQRISGCFGSVRQFGKDRRITELGFFIEKV